MTKRIIALALCVLTLFSLTSCGMLNINIGGFSDTGIREMLLSPITTVMSSDNYKISIGMMYYYYVEQYHLFMSGAKENIKYTVTDTARAAFGSNSAHAAYNRMKIPPVAAARGMSKVSSRMSE